MKLSIVKEAQKVFAMVKEEGLDTTAALRDFINAYQDNVDELAAVKTNKVNKNRRSVFRNNAEDALELAGIIPPRTVFIDNSKSAKRIKMCTRRAPTNCQIKTIFDHITSLNPGKQVKVWYNTTRIHCYFRGICVKVWK